ncbi:beta-Ig-H3/fasciclin [Pseudopedobacter saltans DSM 12145]|uniref:Beta-Ig-H3/fasciclin n=1 Tax=Pseudopedobacter saltans (strain ATCC 51119 / DSM 12145 / JCM 21818 / CCUG 39354 / LMG 10337 / NBRC 100064 / NCIMB 13643) TaxID=762903 RepID=F0S5Q9_PSESL|nr:fasciclin domain-containing protein [Pseudopedobacter saltans]ADY54233.1 beta-Ig-H3/fasciclin [Pseudopedobacter saltans DSM 12145]
MKRDFKTWCLLIIVMIISILGCEKQSLVYTTDNSVNITGYLDSDPGNFSEFRKILELTGTAGYLNAWGAYTLFLPNNSAVEAYLKDVGKTSVEQVDIETWKNLVKFHLIEDTLSTSNFKDGKLPNLTMYGQYLITGAQNLNGVTKITVNRQANLVKGNVIAGNGVIHVIDRMLIPAKLSLAKMIEADPKYSIFTQALKETSLYDSLNILPVNNKNRWFTVIAETDSTLQAAGFPNYAALKARLSKTGNPKSPADSLRKFVEFHILPEIKYLSDIVSAPSHATVAPAEVITSKLSGTKVLINDDDFNGKHETGITLKRDGSDISATNGVLHTAAPYTAAGVTSSGHLAIKVRVPLRIDWDVADFPELRALPAYFRRAKTTFAGPVNLSTIFTVGGARNTALYYEYSASEKAVYGDYLNLPLGAPNRVESFTLTTPLLVRGKYKVWICYKYYKKSSSNKANVNQVSIDGVPMQRTFDSMAKRPSGSEAELEAQGWKQYLNNQTDNNYNSRLLGIIDLPSTKTYKFEIKWVSGSSSDTYIDLVQFIPVDQNQIHPMINQDGTREY